MINKLGPLYRLDGCQLGVLNKIDRIIATFYDNHNPDSKVPGANMGPIWGRQDPDGPHVGPRKFAIWEYTPHGAPAMAIQDVICELIILPTFYCF